MIKYTGNSNYPGEDRRLTPYSNIEFELLQALQDAKNKQAPTPAPEPVKEDKKPLTFSLMWQIITTVGSAAVMGIGLYTTNHDEQLNMRADFRNFQERYKEDQERHNQTHSRIFEEVKELKVQSESMESTLTQSIARGRK